MKSLAFVAMAFAALDRGGIVAPRSGVLAVAPGAGVPGLVVVFARPSGSEKLRFLPYGPGFKGGVRVAVGDVNGDATPDIITAPGSGPPEVKVFDGKTAAQLAAFFAYDPKFKGGVFVAAGDVNGDGLADIITGAGAGSGGGPHVKVFDGATGVVLKSFFPFDAAFKGGVRVAVGDVDGGGGRGEIVTGGGKGNLGTRVRFFDANANGGTPGLDILPFDPAFTGGVFVAAGN